LNVKKTLPIYDDRLLVETPATVARPDLAGRRRGFSLIEVLVVMSLLSLIVLVLMTVFNSTQTAFRAGVTQTDVLEGSRMAMDLMVTDLKLMSPSGGTNTFSTPPENFPSINFSSSGVNFYLANNSTLGFTPAYTNLVQNLPGSSAQRTNSLSYFFMLGRQNTQWTGIGYIVNSASTNTLYPLYRFYQQTNVQSNPYLLFNNFLVAIAGGLGSQQWTNNLSHIIDGVVDLRVRVFDGNGYQMTNTAQFNNSSQLTIYRDNQNATNVAFTLPLQGEVGCYFFKNALPASVELQLGVLEDRPLQRAASIPVAAQANYLAQQAGRVHIFRQRVTIPNVDPTAY